MNAFKLLSGREVRVCQVEILDTCALTLGETPNSWITASIRKSIKNSLKERFWDIKAIHIFDENQEILPRYQVAAQIHSDSIAKGYDLSVLIICFFTDNININLQTIIAEKLSSIIWEDIAGDLSVLSGETRNL